MTDTAKRWPNGVVPIVLQSGLGEYCSSNLQMAMCGVERNIPLLSVPLHLQWKVEIDWTKQWR